MMRKQLYFIIALLMITLVVASRPVQSNQNSIESFSRTDFTLSGAGHVQFGSPTVADLTGDGNPEILIGTTRYRCSGSNCGFNATAKLFAYTGTGTVLWSQSFDAPINSAPAVGDIDANGDMEILLTTGGHAEDGNANGQLIALDHNGNEVWHFDTQDFYPPAGYRDGAFGSPTLCNADSDPQLEIAFSAWDQRIYLISHTGQSLWNNIPGSYQGIGFMNGDTSWSTPACADFNNDGQDEVVVGSDITGGGILPDGTQPEDGGFLYVFSGNGTILARRQMPEAIYASPAIGDIDGNGTLEIVSGTAWVWWDLHGRTSQPYVYVFSSGQLFGTLPYSDPNKLPHYPGWPQATIYPGFSSPALANIDDNPYDLEIIIGTSDPFIVDDAGLGAGKVYAWHHNGQLVNGWPITPHDSLGKNSFIYSSPTVADVDGDCQPEILFSMLWEIFVYNTSGAFQERLAGDYSLFASPAVADVDGDDKKEIWIGGSQVNQPNTGHLWRYENNTIACSTLYKDEWPQFHKEASHRGRYVYAAAIDIQPQNLVVVHQFGSGEFQSVVAYLQNPGSLTLDWSVDTQPNFVTIIAPNSGAIQPHEIVPLTLRIDTSGAAGSQKSGNVILVAENSLGEPVNNSPLTLPVKVYIWNTIYRYLLPAVCNDC